MSLYEYRGFITNALWVALALYWFYGRFRVKTTVRQQQALPAWVRSATLAFALVLLFYPFGGVLGRRFVPDTELVGWTGLALTVAGILFGIWARAWIGANWSSSVTVKQDHELIRTGPYGVVRHPIYSGILVALSGSALEIGRVRALLAVGLFFGGWLVKAMAEERFMRQQFGTVYDDYSRRVKRFVPFVF